MKIKFLIFSMFLSFILISNSFGLVCPKNCEMEFEIENKSYYYNSSNLFSIITILEKKVDQLENQQPPNQQTLIDLFNQKIVEKNQEIADLEAKMALYSYIFLILGIILIIIAVTLFLRMKNGKKKGK